MVVAFYKRKLCILRINILRNLLHGCKIKRCSFYGCDLARRNGTMADLGIMRSLQPYFDIFHGCFAVISLQIKIRMICHIDKCILVRRCKIVDLQCIVFCQLVRHGEFTVSRKSQQTVLAGNRECHCIFRLLLFRLPHRLMQSRISITVQIIVVVIDDQIVYSAVQFKLSFCCAVCNRSDRRAEAASVYKVIFCSVITEYNILYFSVFVRYKQIYKDRAEIHDISLHPILIFQTIQYDVFSCDRSAKFSFFYHAFPPITDITPSVISPTESISFSTFHYLSRYRQQQFSAVPDIC